MKQILVLEDEPALRQLLVRVLSRFESEVVAAENGAIVRELVEPPALVVTDIVMPDVEGIETILTLRRQFPATPIIAISGGGLSASESDYLANARKLGATETLAKPFSPHQLIAMVRRLCPSFETHAAAGGALRGNCTPA